MLQPLGRAKLSWRLSDVTFLDVQLAVVGFIATDLGIHLPGAVHNVGSVAAHDAAVKFGGMSQILLWVSVAEVWSAIAVKEM